VATQEQSLLYAELSWIPRKVVARLVKRIPPGLFDDISAAANMGLWEIIVHYGHKPRLEIRKLAWVRCTGACIDELRRCGRIGTTRRGRNPSVSSLHDLPYEPSQAPRQPELLDTFFRALEALSDRHREILLRHQVDGVMLQDIAKEQGVSTVLISQLHAVALNKILAALD